jgi:hypothetical protein
MRDIRRILKEALPPEKYDKTILLMDKEIRRSAGG